jgi:superfamily II DNA or RNA helicase
VVVHKEFLMDQWTERIEKFLPAAKIGRVQQDECDFRGKTIVMGMVHSLGGDETRYPDDLWEWPGLIIVDECHRIGARTWAPVPPRFASKYRLGFTATPRRKDGADDVFWQHIGPIVFAGKEERLKPVVKRVWTKFKLVKTDRFNPSLAPKALMTRFLVKSRFRNDLIVSQLIAALEAGRKILVLSERLQHLQDMEMLLRKFWPAMVGEVSIGQYVGGRTKAQLEKSAKARVIFATSQYAAEGLDIPALDTLFLTTPMSDVEQAVGRIQRPFSGKKDPIVVDFRDDMIPMFEAMGRKRDRFYRKVT